MELVVSTYRLIKVAGKVISAACSGLFHVTRAGNTQMLKAASASASYSSWSSGRLAVLSLSALLPSLVHAAIPNLITPTISPAAGLASLTLKADATGIGYFTLLPGTGTTCGTGAQVKAGTNAADAIAVHGSLLLTANTDGRYSQRNLSASSAYTLCFTAEDVLGALQSTPASASFSTAAQSVLGSTWGAVGSAGFSAGRAYYPALALAPDGTPYVVYMDNYGGKATVMKFDGSTWAVVGSAGFSADTPYSPSLAFAPDGTPYVVYQDGNGGKATVMKFDGSLATPAWVTVGSASFSAGAAISTILAFAPDGTPYVVYKDVSHSSKATVMKFNGSTWGAVGGAGFSAGTANFTALAFAPNGTPYVVYQDAGNSSYATVMKFNGSTWGAVGSAGFSAGVASYPTLAFAPDGTPYVGYMDAANGNKATVMKFNGSTWGTVGLAGFSADVANYPALALAPNGTPYVVYQDGNQGSKATAMKFDGSLATPAWVAVGSAGFSAGPTSSTGLAFAPDGTPYVLYQDGGNGSKATVMRLLPAPGLSYSAVSFAEAAANNGSITATATLTLTNDTFNGSNGDELVGLGKVVVGNVPNGLTVTVSLASSTTATLAFTGNAAAHAAANGISNLSLTFQDSAFAHGNAAGVTNGARSDLAITFTDPPAVAPTLSAPVINSPSADLATLTLNANANGTGYFTLLPGTGTACGTGAQVKAGTNASNVSVVHGSLPLTANTNGSYSLRNLSASSAYTVCFTAADGIGTLQSTPASTSFSTAAQSALGSTWGTVGSAGFSVGAVVYTALAFAPDGMPYVVYQDAGNANKATVMKFDGSTWGTVGSAGISAGTANYTALAFSQDGTPYVVYTDVANGGKATVMKFDGSTWGAVGIPGFSAGAANYNALAFSPGGTPYVVYSDAGNTNKAMVMKFDGSAWATVGSAGFSAGGVANTALAFAPDGMPYVVYQDAGNANKATVMKFDGSTWATVGSAGFSVDTVGNTSLAFAPNGTPYVVYQDFGNSRKATVMKFDGSTWGAVGLPGFSAGRAIFTSLAFAPDGTPYVVYEDLGNGYKATVMKFDGSTWATVGSAGFSAGQATYTALTFSPDGTPYVVYQDNGNGSKATVMRLLPSRSLGYSVTSFAEAAANDGSITATATLTLTGDFFTGMGGELVDLGKVVVGNVPAGLTVTVTLVSGTVATLAFTGSAAAHAAANGITNLTLTFQDSAFDLGNAASVTNGARSDLAITFANPAAVAPVDGGSPAVVTPPNPFNTAGSSTSSEVGLGDNNGTSFTHATNGLISNLANLNSQVGVSDNGVVVINASIRLPVQISSNAPDNILFSLPSSQSVGLQIGGKGVNVSTNTEPVKDSSGKSVNAVLATKTLTNEQGQTVQSVQVVKGQASASSSEANQIIGGLTLSKDSNLRDVTVTGGSTGSTAGFYKNPSDQSGAISAESGQVTIFVKRHTSPGSDTVTSAKSGSRFAADANSMLTLQAGEVARFDGNGELLGVFLGSLSGSLGKLGDRLSTQAPAGFTGWPSNIPDLIGNNSSARLGGNFASAMFAESTGNSLVQDKSNGTVTINLTDNRVLYALPLGNLSVDSSKADGIVTANDGSLELTAKGVTTHLVPVLADASAFATTFNQTYGLNVRLRDNGSLSVTSNASNASNNGGVNYLLLPRFEVTPSSQATGLNWSADSKRLSFVSTRGAQVLDPLTYDFAQLNGLVTALGQGWTLQHNADGSLSISGPAQQQYQLLPDYLTHYALDGVSQSKSVGSAWIDNDGKFYLLYSTGFLPVVQGFSVQ